MNPTEALLRNTINPLTNAAKAIRTAALRGKRWFFPCVSVVAVLHTVNHEITCWGVHDTVVEAAYVGDLKTVRLLADSDPDLSRTGFETHWTPLVAATLTNQVPLVRFLLNKGVDVHVKADHGETALAVARREGHERIVNLLVEAGAKY